MMNLEFYGVRGSYPVCEYGFNEYGGNTACVSLTKEWNGEFHRIILDAGTGIVPLGRALLYEIEQSKTPYHIHILLTHYHFDHIQGLCHFAPTHHPNAVIHLYGMDVNNTSLEGILTDYICGVTFPVPYSDMKSTRFHTTILDRSTFDIGPFHIQAMKAGLDSHPTDGCLYFRIQDVETKKTVACVWDHEAYEAGNKSVIDFIKGSNILIHDTHYTTADYFSKSHYVRGYGHSTYSMAIKSAKQAGIKDSLFGFHYNPQHNDRVLDDIHQTRQRESNIELILPKQGETFFL